jgi:dihydroorotase/N-acyl-D-amino-acid deacylase
VVAPGFIDIQAQSYDNFMRGDGRALSMVTQGITTAILGEGFTPAPVNDKLLATIPPSDTAGRRLAAQFTGPHGFGRWLDFMIRRGASENVGSFVGSATVRAWAKGEAMGAFSAAERDSVTAMVRRVMEDGAFGVASALQYPPDNYNTTEDLIHAAKAMATFGGVYITHMRSEGERLLEAIDETLRIGRESGVPVEIYHLKASGTVNWPKMALAIAKIDSARAAGQDVSADMYAYVAGATGLTACLPPWASADGKLLDNLRDSVTRARIRADVLSERSDWENLCSLATPDGVLVLGLVRPENERWAGKRLSAIAADQGKDWLDAAIGLILSEQTRIGTVFFLMSEDNVALQLRQPWIKFGTDADGVDPDSVRTLTHPRAYGNYPRILGTYVREQRVLTLEDAIRKMTSAVANRLSIMDRGLLREGMYADVVVFDPRTIADRATFEQPHQLSVGVRYVFVNGTAVVRDGRHTGAKPGRPVRGPGYVR